jgi:hypothetical protein
MEMRKNSASSAHHPRAGGGLVRRREAAFICAADAAVRIPAMHAPHAKAWAGMVGSVHA